MKRTLMAFALLSLNLLTIPAQAEVRREVGEISSVSYDGKTLEVRYRTGGGCQKHTGEIELALSEDKEFIITKVIDVTPEYDACEAYIGGTAKINLKEKAAELLKANGSSSCKSPKSS